LAAHLFFDLDGTLTDPAPGITACLLHATSALGGSGWSLADLRRFIGPPLKDVFAEIFATEDAALIDEAIRCYRERFSTVGLYENAVYTDVPPALAALREQGHALRVVTSKPHVYADRIVDHFGLRQYFARVYGAELSGERSAKAELIAFALQSEGVGAERACMIGDRSHDVAGAKACGVRAIGVTWGYGTREELERAGADCVVDDVAALLAVVGAR
jgi:phosphoglycolate phosphatase